MLILMDIEALMASDEMGLIDPEPLNCPQQIDQPTP